MFKSLPALASFYGSIFVLFKRARKRRSTLEIPETLLPDVLVFVDGNIVNGRERS